MRSSSNISKALIVDFLYQGLLRYSFIKLLFLSIYVSLCSTKDDDCILVSQSDINVSILYSMRVEFLSCWSVLFLFFACFHAFHRNLAFGVLDSSSYIEILISRPHFPPWHWENWAISYWPSRTTPCSFLSSTSTECPIFCIKRTNYNDLKNFYVVKIYVICYLFDFG